MTLKKLLPGLLLMLALDCGAVQQSELKDAMQTGGPAAAIGVCNTRAMPITRQVGLYPEDPATGFKVGDIRGAFVAIRKLSD